VPEETYHRGIVIEGGGIGIMMTGAIAIGTTIVTIVAPGIGIGVTGTRVRAATTVGEDGVIIITMMRHIEGGIAGEATITTAGKRTWTNLAATEEMRPGTIRAEETVATIIMAKTIETIASRPQGRMTTMEKPRQNEVADAEDLARRRIPARDPDPDPPPPARSLVLPRAPVVDRTVVRVAEAVAEIPGEAGAPTLLPDLDRGPALGRGLHRPVILPYGTEIANVVGATAAIGAGGERVPAVVAAEVGAGAAAEEIEGRRSVPLPTRVTVGGIGMRMLVKGMDVGSAVVALRTMMGAGGGGRRAIVEDKT